MLQFYRLRYSLLSICLLTLGFGLLLSSTLQGQVIFSDDFERAELGSDWENEPFAQWSIQDGKAFNFVEGPGGKLATTQSFNETDYVVETIAYPFEYGYWREYYLTFGEQSTPDSSYAVRYDAAFGGTLQLLKSTDNIYFSEVLDSELIGLNPVDPLKLKVEHSADGTIQVFIAEVGSNYADTALLVANDVTYPNLGKFGWHIATQTAAQAFYVEEITASVLETSPLIFSDEFDRTTLGSFWADQAGWSIVNGQAYNDPDGNYLPLTTAQTFPQTSYILETEAFPFVDGYYRKYFLLFGQEADLGDGYQVSYDPYLGNTLTLGVGNGNYFFPEVLDDRIVDLDPTKAYRIKVAKYESGLIQVYLGDEDGYPDVPTLEAIDTTYPILGKVSWIATTQTAGEDFFVEFIQAEVPSEQKTQPEKPAEDELIKQVVVESPNSYSVGKLTSGTTFFTDRPYVLTDVPEFLQGASFVKTANDDKTRTDPTGFLTVYLKAKAVAYVAYDPRSTTRPAWLEDWTKLDDVLGTTDPGADTYELYARLVDQAFFSQYRDQLRIGANLAPPASGSNMNYLVAFLPVSSDQYQAEDATLQGPRVATNHTGFEGSGFVDYINANNDFIEWSVDVTAAAPYVLVFRYANGSPAPRNLQVLLDGQTIDTLQAISTRSWSNWVTTQIKPVFISAGEHQVRLLAIGDSGPNVDWLRLSPTRYFTPNTETSAARIANTEKATSADPEVLPSQPEVIFYPNPVVNQIHLALPTGHSSGELDVQIMDVNGREVYRNRWTRKY